MVFTLYFLFVDGRHLASMVIRSLPIERTYARMFLSRMRESGRQLIVGFFLVSLFQSAMMFILCLVFGVPRALVLASLTAVASFIPMAGTALVWMPLGLVMILGGTVAKGVLFMLAAAVLVSSLDNFIRPLLLGERLKIHPLLIFFSILGGLQIFGFNGLILGPLILIIFFSAVDLYDSLEGNSPGDDAEAAKRSE
jgi:predicted PurR-regulated permease PerM